MNRVRRHLRPGVRRVIRLGRRLSRLGAFWPRATLPFQDFQAFGTLEDYLADRVASQGVIAARRRIEASFVTGEEAFTVPGFCAFCARPTGFLADFLHAGPAAADGRRVPNWRERMLCRRCGLNNRTRAILHFLRQRPAGSRRGRHYFSEQVTPLFEAAAALFPRIVGSEFLRDGTAPGQRNAAGLRHEDLTQLSFADASLDVVCTCDVLEHVPDTGRALAECFRCLKPGGLLLISVPFRTVSAETLVRARIGADGRVEHIEPPEYHGDPMNGSGALCFYHFGWDFLDALRRAGFSDVTNRFYWSDKFGHFGDGQQIIVAIK